MKKTKLLAVVLVVSIILMGAGYAYWQQDLKINATVDTGYLNVQFAPSSHVIGDVDGKIQLPKDLWKAITNPTDFDGSEYMDVSVSGSEDYHDVEFTFSDIYPGAGGYVSFKIVNTGTVPAKLTGVTHVILEGSEWQDKFEYTIHNLVLVRKGGRFLGFPYPDIDIVQAPITCSSFEDFVTKLSDLMDDYTLEPGDWWELNKGEIASERAGYSIVMPLGDSVNNELENQTFIFKLSVNFQQQAE